MSILSWGFFTLAINALLDKFKLRYCCYCVVELQVTGYNGFLVVLIMTKFNIVVLSSEVAAKTTGIRLASTVIKHMLKNKENG